MFVHLVRAFVGTSLYQVFPPLKINVTNRGYDGKKLKCLH